MIGSFASGTTAPSWPKMDQKKIISLLWIKSSKKPLIKKLHKVDTPKSGNYDSKHNFEIFQKPKIKLKKDP